MMERRGFLGSLLALVFGWKVLEEESPTRFHNEYLPGDPSLGSGEWIRASDLSPYLTDTDAWYLLNADEPLTFHWRPSSARKA